MDIFQMKTIIYIYTVLIYILLLFIISMHGSFKIRIDVITFASKENRSNNSKPTN